jgi:translation initiation factor IF-3
MSVRAALALADEAGVDLVEIAPMAQPPVCRIVDFGKFKYQEQKRQHEQKLKQKQVQVKEVKFRPGTDENDYQIKLRNMTRFLEEEDKVKVTLRFRGREMAHQDIGMRQIERIKSDLQGPGGSRADAEDGRSPDGHGVDPEQEEIGSDSSAGLRPATTSGAGSEVPPSGDTWRHVYKRSIQCPR